MIWFFQQPARDREGIRLHPFFCESTFQTFSSSTFVLYRKCRRHHKMHLQKCISVPWIARLARVRVKSQFSFFSSLTTNASLRCATQNFYDQTPIDNWQHGKTIQTITHFLRCCLSSSTGVGQSTDGWKIVIQLSARILSWHVISKATLNGCQSLRFIFSPFGSQLFRTYPRKNTFLLF